MEAAVRIGLTSVTPTDLPCQWNQTFTKNIVGCPVANIDLYTDSAKSKILKREPVKKPEPVQVPNENFVSFVDSIQEVAPNAVGLSLFARHQQHFIFQQETEIISSNKLPDSLRKLYKKENLKLSKEEYDEVVIKSIEKIQSNSEQDIAYIEEATRNQSMSFAWYEQRAGRITGSTFMQASRTSLQNPSKSLITKICSDKKIELNVPALMWGKEHESDAIKLYESTLTGQLETSIVCKSLTDSNIHENFQVEQFGLCILKEKQWYGASPDSIVYCDCCSFRVLEVKCPFSLRDKSLQEEIDSGNFYIIKDEEGIYKLKKNHQYFYQVQLEMYVCSMENCDFMVWTPNEFIIINVPFDLEFMKIQIAICDKFWKDAILRELLLRTLESSSNVDDIQSTSANNIIHNEKLCICGSNEGEMVGCDSCDNWFHPKCVKRKTLPTTKTWYCKNCKKNKQ